MAIAVRVHDDDPRALAEVIAATMAETGVVDRETGLAHLSVLVANEEREEVQRRDSWRWLNAARALNRDNDWSEV